jgi:putative transposase
VLDETLAALVPVVGVKPACELIGASRARYYRRNNPPPACEPSRPRPTPPNALSDAERSRILTELHRPEHADLAVAQVWARLLDDGVYLASESTFYRILREHGESGERRRQATHPAKTKPQLRATGPNQCWSWDITKLRGPRRGVYYDLYVIIDIFSRYVVGWTIAEAEDGNIAKALIAAALNEHGIDPGQLNLHADRGSAMTSKPVVQLLIDLGVARTHSRPKVSNDNPYSESNFKTLKYCPAFPPLFGSIQDARAFCTRFFDYYNHEHRHSGIGLHTPASVHTGDAIHIRHQRQKTLDRAYIDNPDRFSKRPPTAPKLPTVAWINPPTPEPLIQSA